MDRGTVRVQAHLSWLACLSISEYCRRCGWAAGLPRCVLCNDSHYVNYRHEACDVHLCMISFDFWAPRYRFKTVIYGRQESAHSDSDKLWKSSQIQMRTPNP